MKINITQLVLKVALALSEVTGMQPGDEQDLDPIMIKSGTTLVTVNINIKQDIKK